MVYAIYIAAAAAVGLLIGFVVLSIGWLRKTVSRNIRSKTLGLLSVYDELLEKKSRELAAKAAASEETPVRTDSPVGQGPVTAAQLSAPPSLRASELLDMAERSGGAVYRDREIGGLYLKIRENFSFRLDELLTVLDCSPREWGGPASRLLEQLDYDTVYRLSTISAEEQIQVLKEALPAEGVSLLDAYLQTHPSFCMLEFYDHLRALADMEPKPACLRVPSGVVMGRMTQNDVAIIPDAEICDGFQLEDGRVLYDYSIKARELS